MKKQIFTLLIMLSLVAVTGKLFAQTKLTPYEDQTYTYTLNGLVDGNLYTVGVNTAVDVYTNMGGTTYSFEGTNSGTVSGTKASVQIRWTGIADAAGPYYVWFRISDPAGCSTYRALTVDPQDPENIVANYAVNYGIVALIAGDDQTNPTTISGTTGSTNETACPAFVGEDWVVTALSEAGTDGNSYIYYRITRSTASAGTPNWAITPSVTTGAALASGWAYASDPGASFTNFTPGNAISNITTADLYLRATVANSSSASQAVQVTVSGGDDLGTTHDTPITHNAAAATLTVTPVPSVGTFE